MAAPLRRASVDRGARLIALALASLAFAAPCPLHAAGDVLGCPAGGNESVLAAPAREANSDELYTRPEAGVPPAKRTSRGLYLLARDAYDMTQADPAGVLFIDVRTRGELQFIGMAVGVDAHVPYLIESDPVQWDEASSSFKLVPNPAFVAAVDGRLRQKGLTRETPVIVICQGGVRAARAADALTLAGYRNVYTVVDGFEGDPADDGPAKGQRVVNGWRNAGLPWTTRLDKTRMYGLD